MAEVLRAPTSEDVGSCPLTLGLLFAQSPDALPIILEERPLEAVEVKVEREMDAFVEELNEVLIFYGGVSEEGEISTTLTIL